MTDALDREMRANIAKRAAAMRDRAANTPPDVRAALREVGAILPDERTQAHFAVIREYLGWLQLCIGAAAHFSALADGSDKPKGDDNG